MQFFIDTTNQQVHALDNDVVVTETNGVYSFATAADIPLAALPTTLQPYMPVAPTAAQIAAQQTALAWATYQGAAQAALAESDKTVLRCYENAVPVPTDWVAYRKALRTIVSATSGDPTQPLPAKPSYPPGT